MRIPGRRLFRFPWRSAAQVTADVEDELDFHLDCVARELIDEGWPPETARAEAARRFGDLEGTRTTCCALDRGKEKQMRWMQWAEALGQDLRLSGRQLVKSPGFTALVVLTLALAVGATTSIFSVVDGVLLRPLPFRDPDRLVRAFPVDREGHHNNFSPLNFLDWSAASRTIATAAAWNNGTLNLSDGGAEPERLQGAIVSARFFEVLGVRPMAGRWFAPEEDKPGATPVAVISEELWKRRFGGVGGMRGGRSVLGRSIELSGKSYLVVGVIAHEDQLPADAEVWIPLVFMGKTSRGAYYLDVVARLAPGASVAKARAETTVIGHRLETQYPDANAGYGLGLEPLQDVMVGEARTPLLVLFGAVLAVLLIACVNVANLLLVRAAARESEVAIRTALGATRSRIVRQLLTESLVLALGGGAFGVLLAVWMTKGLVALAPAQTPRLEEVGMNGWVLAFALGIALVTGVLFGLAPAIQASRAELVTALKEAARGSRGRGSTVARNLLVVSEVALAVVLLAGAGLLIQSFARLQKVDLGFRPQQVVTCNLSLPDAKYENQQLWAFMDGLTERLQKLPGVLSAGAGTFAMPLTSSEFVLDFAVEGRPPVAPGQPQDAMRVAVVTPQFFQTLGVPLLRGRGFTDRDRDGSLPVVLLNAAAARRYFPGENPLGQRILLGWRDHGVQRGGEVVGIVGGYRQGALDKEADPQLFLPYAQAPLNGIAVILRTTGRPQSVAAAVRAQVHELDPAVPLFGVQSLDDVIAASASQPKFYLLLLGGFAAIALVLAAVGIYGVIAYAVRQRTQEIGIRMALGATRQGVQGMVVRQGLTLAGCGALAGLAGALFATRWMRSLVYQVSVRDPAIHLAVVVTLVGVAALASWLPARRAARTEPQLALRGEG